MLSSLLRPNKRRRDSQRSPFSSPSRGPLSPDVTRRSFLSGKGKNVTYDDNDERYRYRASYPDDGDRDGDDHDHDSEDDSHDDEDDNEDDDEDGAAEDTPLLPIFSAVHLGMHSVVLKALDNKLIAIDALPIYSLTHTLRLVIISRCETTLSWDQLRSPQVSQFLVKPIQQTIQSSHFSKATLYALMANCLQFGKEVQRFPGNSGTSKTRAMLCELIAIRLLKEYTIRELIDALSYDFFPLQGSGQTGPGDNAPRASWDFGSRGKPPPRVARLSCLEIAIRAPAKRFLAHPLVVQHLEAIWAGTIVFHSAADNLHRRPVNMTPQVVRGYGTNNNQSQTGTGQKGGQNESAPIQFRRSVTLYNPRDASLFKLSRLRVPRYRQFLSTLSLAILLALFLSVLVRKSLEITPLEVVFWFWSAGYMLDEIVGFNEQGFSLYLMSFWNVFDVGILLILLAHYCLRLYGILMPDARKHSTANWAYDVLAMNAVLLFPRLFSVLDHYRYFSQLLIAFRMMAADLVAVFILIVIACSGFFVAFTLSFGNYDRDTPQSVLYALFQMLMGFTPAAWDRWSKYNALGQFLLVAFLFIAHFLIVTILITVLTNSFMAIVQNANEEHQFLFAVNTISMVKSDALFSYIAPANIFAWLLTPLRYVMPFRKFVKLNRTVIKVTHFPILFSICMYEKLVLAASVYEPTDLIDDPRGRSPNRNRRRRRSIGGIRFFSPSARMREHSVATYHQDRALDELFRKPFNDDTVRTQPSGEELRHKTSVVNNWMQGMGPDYPSPPAEQDRSVLDRLETKRPALRRPFFRSYHPGVRDFTDATRSVASDPEDFGGPNTGSGLRNMFKPTEGSVSASHANDVAQQTDADGDDELPTSDNDDEDHMTLTREVSNLEDEDDEVTPDARRDSAREMFSAGDQAGAISSSYSSAKARFVSPPARPASRRHSPNRRPKTPRHHDRTISSNTILFNPLSAPKTFEPATADSSDNSGVPTRSPPKTRQGTSGHQTPLDYGRRTPKFPPASPGPVSPPKARPTMPNRSAFKSAPDLAGVLGRSNPGRRRPPSIGLDIGSDIGDNKAVQIGALPASFHTELDFADIHARIRASGPKRTSWQKRSADDSESDNTGMFGRLLLARMNDLEGNFKEVMREIKEMNSSSRRDSSEDSKAHSPGPSRASRHHSRRQTATKIVGATAAERQEKRRSAILSGNPEKRNSKLGREDKEKSAAKSHTSAAASAAGGSGPNTAPMTPTTAMTESPGDIDQARWPAETRQIDDERSEGDGYEESRMPRPSTARRVSHSA